jgi:hypothetical protein
MRQPVKIFSPTRVTNNNGGIANLYDDDVSSLRGWDGMCGLGMGKKALHHTVE